jgi:hypothetical protein
MKICTQEPLFDPLTNLKAARLLYELQAGRGQYAPDKNANKQSRPCSLNHCVRSYSATTVLYSVQNIT